MKYRIICNDKFIGESDLELRDPSMGVLAGVFVPTPAYAEVQTVFRLQTEAGTSVADTDPDKWKIFIAAREKLGVSAESESGMPLPAVSRIDIFDYSVELNEYEVTIFTGDGRVYDQYCAVT